jgi:hypothetical protein
LSLRCKTKNIFWWRA